MICFLRKICLLCLVFILLGSMVDAEELHMSMGVKSWYSAWEIEGEGGEAQESDSVPLIGPTIKLAYGKYFGGVSVMTTVPEYEFDAFEWARTDVDVLMGYFVHPRVSVMGGWKYLRGSTDTAGSHSAYGPAFGVSCNYPLGNQRTSLYANFALLLLQGTAKVPNDVDGTISENDFDLLGYSAEGGVAFALLERISFNLGYKYQYIEWRHAVNDIVTGVTMGISYSF